MKRTAIRVVPAIALLALGVATFVPRVKGQNTGQPSTKNGEWPMYTADLSGSKYSPLDQIGANNFSKLEVAWRFKTDSLGPRPETMSTKRLANTVPTSCSPTSLCPVAAACPSSPSTMSSGSGGTLPERQAPARSPMASTRSGARKNDRHRSPPA